MAKAQAVAPCSLGGVEGREQGHSPCPLMEGDAQSSVKVE